MQNILSQIPAGVPFLYFPQGIPSSLNTSSIIIEGELSNPAPVAEPTVAEPEPKYAERMSPHRLALHRLFHGDAKITFIPTGANHGAVYQAMVKVGGQSWAKVKAGSMGGVNGFFVEKINGISKVTEKDTTTTTRKRSRAIYQG